MKTNTLLILSGVVATAAVLLLLANLWTGSVIGLDPVHHLQCTRFGRSLFSALYTIYFPLSFLIFAAAVLATFGVFTCQWKSSILVAGGLVVFLYPFAALHDEGRLFLSLTPVANLCQSDVGSYLASIHLLVFFISFFAVCSVLNASSMLIIGGFRKR